MIASINKSAAVFVDPENILSDLQKQLSSCQSKKETARLESNIRKLEAYLELSLNQPVTDGKKLGAIANLFLNQSGLLEVWVSWYGASQVSEQPECLKTEEFLNEIHLGVREACLNLKALKFNEVNLNSQTKNEELSLWFCLRKKLSRSYKAV